jgi:hypothetical protein
MGQLYVLDVKVIDDVNHLLLAMTLVNAHVYNS